jgi:hypothetical protein
MKKLAICLMITCLSLTLLPLQLMASTTDKPSSSAVTKPPEPVESTELNALLRKTDNFNTIEDSKLISNNMKNSQVMERSPGHHRRNGGVIYISAGAVVLIVILIVVLL